MTLTKSEMEQIREEQDSLGLTEAEIEQIDANRALYDPFGNPKGEACEACGDESCIKSLATIGEGNKIHNEDHPYMKNRRAEENRRGY